MRLRTRVDLLTTTLLAALGTGPLGCGGSAVADRAQPGSGGSTAGAGGTAPNPHPCENPIATADGYEQCADGTRRRLSGVTCSNLLPRPDPVPNHDPAVDNCRYDAECTTAPYGYCEEIPVSIGGGPYHGCSYGCITDADCGIGAICVCGGGPIGECQPGSCASSADCGPGFDCRSYTMPQYCGPGGFACQTPDDGCATDADCVGSANGATCTHLSGSRFCSNIVCEVGRPFLIQGEARVAPAEPREDWLAGAVEPAVDALPPGLRDRLAAQWLRAAQMEHASIAAFARFTLQLVSLGAPAHLVEAASRAMADETLHAKLCFALASRYQGRALGPGPLAIDGSIEQSTLAQIVISTLHEGCIGETVAAIEAAEAAEHATDPVVRAALRRISADETRHAELAWRFVSWAIGAFGSSVLGVVKEELESIGARSSFGPAALASSDDELLEHGVLPQPVRRELKAEVLTQVVGPCARSLCGAALKQADLPFVSKFETT